MLHWYIESKQLVGRRIKRDHLANEDIGAVIALQNAQLQHSVHNMLYPNEKSHEKAHGLLLWYYVWRVCSATLAIWRAFAGNGRPTGFLLHVSLILTKVIWRSQGNNINNHAHM